MTKNLNEKSKSVSQQQLFGMAHAAQKGELKNPSPEVKKIAKTVAPGEVKKFASTPHKDLPKHVHEDYQAGPRDSSKDTYQKGTMLSPQVRSATTASTSHDRHDMQRQRPIAKELGTNPTKLLDAYNSYGNMLARTHRMKEIAENLGNLIESAEGYLMGEANDWYDSHTLSRNIKEIKKYSQDFGKIAEEYDTLHDRAHALYEDMGHLLGRYFKSNTQEQALGKPYECADCKTRMGVDEVEASKRCPSCGSSKISISDALGEVKDANWLASKDRKLATVNRVQQDAEDREKHIDEIERVELWTTKDKMKGTRAETFEMQNEGEAPEYDRPFGGEMDKDEETPRQLKDNAMPSLSALAPIKIDSKQWKDSPAGAKLTQDGKKYLTLPGGTAVNKEEGGASYLQPVETGNKPER